MIDYVRVYEDTPNVAPTVEVTSPTEGDNPAAGDITLFASASDSDGSIDRVEFWVGNEILGEDATAPYSVVWSGAGAGCYVVRARAFDDDGAYRDDLVDVTVGTGCGQAAYLGSAFVLPTRVETEDFDLGGQDIAYNETDTSPSV